MSDICIDIPGGKFNYRVGAIIIHDGKLLMVKNSGTDFYYTVGGRVKFGESARETLAREALEETGEPLEVDKLAFIHENFFNHEDFYNNDTAQIHFHEVCMFFLMKPYDKMGEIRQSFAEDYGEVSIHWLPIDKLGEYTIYPEFFKTELAKQHTHVRYIVTRDNETMYCN